MSVFPANPHFPTTRWTGVLSLREKEDLTVRRQALADICQGYWYPLYAFARRMGCSQQDAEDLTQGFFAHALECEIFKRADRSLGTLRTFLRRSFQRYSSDVRDRENAQKRGGGLPALSLDLDVSEELYCHDRPPMKRRN